MLAMEARSPEPQQVGALLALEPSARVEPEQLARVLAERAASVPRLRQRLVPVPPGCGRPIWLDVPGFDPAAHVRVARCPSPVDEPALLGLAASVVADPLPRGRPLWSAVVVSGPVGEPTAVVVVLHHVLADGLGGLAVLGRLLDAGPGDPGLPARATAVGRPRWTVLLSDAVRSDLAGLRRLPTAWRELRRALAAAGGLRGERAARCSLLAPTGRGSRLAVARVDLAGLRAAAHRHGGTLNDAVLGAVGGALHALLQQRGESVDVFRVAVMVSTRRAADAAEPGNRVTPLIVGVPGAGPPHDRLRRIAGAVGRVRDQATGPPVVGVLGPVFRVAARAGLYRVAMTHQRRLHTLVSNVRGPAGPQSLAGAPVSSVVPVALGESGNVTLSFVALSYAGTLAVTVIADPAVTDLAVVTTALQDELDALVRSAAVR